VTIGTMPSGCLVPSAVVSPPPPPPQAVSTAHAANSAVREEDGRIREGEYFMKMSRIR
jgi:hypothetical protein